MKKRKQREHRDRPESEKRFGESSNSVILMRPSTVQLQVETFKLYSDLRKSNTDVRNSLPSPELIDREKKYIAFDEQRRESPHLVRYKEFYKVLTPASERRAPRDIVLRRPALN